MDIRAERISKAIKDKGLSYAELERITGVSKSALQRYATGETKKIPVDVIEKIAAATGVTARYLMGWDAQETEIASFDLEALERLREAVTELKKENAPDDKVRGDIIKMVRELSDSQAKQLRDFLKGMIPGSTQ